MDKLGKLQIIKPILVKVLTAIKNKFPWLDVKDVKIKRDSSLYDDNGTTVWLIFQRCKTKDGKEININDSLLSYRNAEHYDDIYNVVGKTLNQMFKEDKHIVEITSGTWSVIKGCPEHPELAQDNYSYYGVRIDIEYNTGKQFVDSEVRRW